MHFNNNIVRVNQLIIMIKLQIYSDYKLIARMFVCKIIQISVKIATLRNHKYILLEIFWIKKKLVLDITLSVVSRKCHFAHYAT
jgi:hypothetical protein